MNWAVRFCLGLLRLGKWCVGVGMVFWEGRTVAARDRSRAGGLQLAARAEKPAQVSLLALVGCFS